MRTIGTFGGGMKVQLKKIAVLLATFAISSMHVGSAFAACIADSGNTRAALVELYTSEGCSSCPPADKALSRIGDSLASNPAPRIVPLALHVDYWDSIGWKDPFAQPAFSQRQEWEVHANRHRTSFTPHFFVNGREVQDWHGDLAENLRRDSGPAAARLQVRAEPRGGNALRVVVDASLNGPVGGAVNGSARTDRGPLQLFIAVTESKLSSQVKAGENRGAKLDHDFVVRNWIGPIDVQGTGGSIDRVVDVPQLARGQIGIVAFLQDAKTAEVLQAVDTGVCKAG